MDERGPLLFEYKPLPMSPMTVALLLLLGIVTIVSPVLVPRELFLPKEWFPLNGACALSVLVIFVAALFQWRSPTRIHTMGIEVSLPSWQRILGSRPWIPWSEVRNAFPATYEIAGAAMSPFASSAGTLVHVGLGLETADGRQRTVKFTPGSIRGFRGESPGFVYAMAAVRQAFHGLGRALVMDVRPYTDEEVTAMHAEARRPLLGLDVIVYAFFLPPTIVAGALVLLNFLRVSPEPVVVVTLLILAAIPPLASMQFTLARSRRRNHLLGELAKHEEFLQAQN